jgi:hypothetical protein
MKDFISQENLPSVTINSDGIFYTPNSILESKLNLLFILMNTKKGELIQNYNFGINLESFLFDKYNMENSIMQNEVRNEIERSVQKNIGSDIKIKSIEAMYAPEENGRVGYMYVNIIWNIHSKYLTESVSVIKLNKIDNNFKTYFTTLQNYNPDEKSNKSFEMLTNDAIIDAINQIKQELSGIVNKYNHKK